MKITVAIPVYNTEQYLTRCLNSIFKQSINDFEVIIVNDNSPNSYHNQSLIDIIKSYDMNKISIINHEKNKGAFQARLTALRQATGEYICFVDADDWVERTYLADLYATIIKNDADISISGFYYAKTRKKRIKSSGNLSKIKMDINNELEVTNTIYKAEIRHCVWNKLYKREMLLNSQVLEVEDYINQSDDLLFNSYVFLEAKSISIIKKPLYNYFLNEASMTNDFSLSTFKNRVNSIKLVMANIETLLKDRQLYDTFHKDIKNRYIQQSFYLISILQRANLNEELYFQAFEYMLNNIEHEYVIKGLNTSPVLKIANLIENRILPPLTFRRYLIQMMYNSIRRMFR